MSETQKSDLTQTELESVITHHRLVKRGGADNGEAIREAKQLEFQDGSGGIIKSLIRKLLSKDKREQEKVLKDPEFLRAVQERAQVEATVLRQIAYGVAISRIADERKSHVDDIRFMYPMRSTGEQEEIITSDDYEKAMELLREVLEGIVFNVDHNRLAESIVFSAHPSTKERSLTKARYFKHWIRTGMTGEDAVNYQTDLDTTLFDELLATNIMMSLNRHYGG